MGMPEPAYYTADMVRGLPEDGNRYETVHGELLVTPAPRAWHQLVARRLITYLANYLERHPTGALFYSPADISWSDGTLVQPDVFVVDLNEARTMDWAQMKSLLLVIEVLSPSTARYDRFTKRRLYQDVRIPYYWVVDPEHQMVEVWTPELELPRVESEQVTWYPANATEQLTVRLSELFKPL